MRMTNTREQLAAEHTERFVTDTSYRDGSLVVSNPYLFTIRRPLLKSPEGLGYRGVHADASTATTATETL